MVCKISFIIMGISNDNKSVNNQFLDIEINDFLVWSRIPMDAEAAFVLK